MPFPYDIFKGLSAPQSNSPIDRRDLLDYQGSNTILSSRYINPITRDFEVSSTNHLMGQNAVEQSVRLAISTTFNSSVLNGFGQNFGSIKVITPFIRTQVNTIIQQALAFQINSNQITMGAIAFSNNGLGQISVQFSYTNNTTGIETPISFLLQ